MPVDEFALLTDPTTRERIIAGVKAAGFANVTIDLAGMQRGAFTMQILKAPHLQEAR